MKNYQIFIFLFFLNLLIGELSKYLLDYNSLIYNNLSEQLAYELIDESFKKIRQWQLLGYLLIPLLLFIKTQIVAGILGIGTFFFDIDVSHKNLWNISLKSEIILFFPSLLKLFWFYFYETDFTLVDLQTFYPFSALNFFNEKELSLWYLYPLQTINLFEILYVIFLAYLLDKMLKSKVGLGIKIVSISYLPALLIWVVSVMFFVLNLS